MQIPDRFVAGAPSPLILGVDTAAGVAHRVIRSTACGETPATGVRVPGRYGTVGRDAPQLLDGIEPDEREGERLSFCRPLCDLYRRSSLAPILAVESASKEAHRGLLAFPERIRGELRPASYGSCPMPPSTLTAGSVTEHQSR